jgi:hypothetical protein
MANLNPVSVLLNQSGEAKDAQVVQAPAFSLTKVLAAAAVIVTPIAAVLVDQLKTVNLTAGNYVALAASVLGFLAIASAADVLGRSYATGAKEKATAMTAAAEKSAEAAQAALGQVVTFETPLAGHRIDPGPDVPIEVLATAYSGEPLVLAKEGEAIKWLRMAEVTIP